ncbi:MAG TPA: hypothetical protein DEO86_12140 [Colwellia sp.]|nr:hypothetical protein [Colwellia sp.]
MKHYKRPQGLTIPDHIAKDVSIELVERLKLDGHGISFPNYMAVQMRYICNGIDLGGSYSISRYGSWENALIAAAKDNEELVITFPNSSRGCSPDRGVFLVKNYKKSRGQHEHYWVMSYNDNQVAKTKSFYCGNDKTITKARSKHAELTAWYYRRLYCETLDPDVVSAENIKGWQKKRFCS